jgi:Ca2+-binding RTX toxin-like protein
VAAGDGNDIVLAGNGADTVTGGEGSDVIVGGRGGDNLDGNGDQDILVAGRTTLSDSALAQVRAEWVFSRDYADRVTNITNVNGGQVVREDLQDPNRLNGDSHLLPITSDRTVFDDDAVDSLNGGAGRDLFFSDFDTNFETDLADDDIIDGRIPSESNIDLR